MKQTCETRQQRSATVQSSQNHSVTGFHLAIPIIQGLRVTETRAGLQRDDDCVVHPNNNPEGIGWRRVMLILPPGGVQGRLREPKTQDAIADTITVSRQRTMRCELCALFFLDPKYLGPNGTSISCNGSSFLPAPATPRWSRVFGTATHQRKNNAGGLGFCRCHTAGTLLPCAPCRDPCTVLAVGCVVPSSMDW